MRLSGYDEEDPCDDLDTTSEECRIAHAQRTPAPRSAACRSLTSAKISTCALPLPILQLDALKDLNRVHCGNLNLLQCLHFHAVGLTGSYGFLARDSIRHQLLLYHPGTTRTACPVCYSPWT